MLRQFGLGVALVFLGPACDGDATDTEAGPGGYVLVGGDALRSGAVLDDGTRLSAMPAALTDDGARTLILRTSIVDLPADADVLTYAFGDDGRRDTLIVGSDVFDDRLAVDGDDAAVQRFAARIDAGLEPAPGNDGRWLLQADDIWARAAASPADGDGIVEVFPVDITPEGGVAVRARHVPDTVPGRTGVIERGLARVEDGEPVVTEKRRQDKAACDDPIAGVWRARTHRGEAYDWHEFTLSIERVPGTAVVTGTIDVRAWSGAADDPLPAVCDDGTPAIDTARMTAHGSWDGKQLDFTGKTLVRSEAACFGGELDGYAIDHFTGALAADGAIRTVNNDGINALNRPYVFRRIGCK
jgi:hypothetical protein